MTSKFERPVGRTETLLGVNWKLCGVLLGHAIHAHDMLCYVVGPIKQVYARTTPRVNLIETDGY